MEQPSITPPVHEGLLEQLVLSPKISAWMQDLGNQLEPLARALVGAKISEVEKTIKNTPQETPELAQLEALCTLLQDMKINPNLPKFNELNWHQYGIITHTLQVVGAVYRMEEVAGEKYDLVAGFTDELMNETIRDVSKWDLFVASMLLHDAGKFLPDFKPGKDGKLVLGHGGHESRSGDIIDGKYPVVNEMLAPFWQRLSADQKKYLCDCVRLHYEFGSFRTEAKKTGDYTVSFVTENPAFKEICENNIFKATPVPGRPNKNEYLREIGLYFLFDSAGKTAIETQIHTDPKPEEIAGWEQFIREKKLPTDLINALKQFPVNRAVAIKFLELVQALKR